MFVNCINEISLYAGAHLQGGSWGSRPALFSRKVKVPFVLENLEAVSCSFVGDLRVALLQMMVSKP